MSVHSVDGTKERRLLVNALPEVCDEGTLLGLGFRV